MTSRARTAEPPLELPPGADLHALHVAAETCRRCDLWRPATQVVFGAGPADARVMVIGEQPGDQEDQAGVPFVGPSGQLFDRALDELGLDRSAMYVTNAVKHFKFVQRGKVRLHQSPNPAEQRACRVWLEAERERVAPAVVVCLGAIASKAVFGSSFGLMKQRGQWQALPDGARGAGDGASVLGPAPAGVRGAGAGVPRLRRRSRPADRTRGIGTYSRRGRTDPHEQQAARMHRAVRFASVRRSAARRIAERRRVMCPVGRRHRRFDGHRRRVRSWSCDHKKTARIAPGGSRHSAGRISPASCGSPAA